MVVPSLDRLGIPSVHKVDFCGVATMVSGTPQQNCFRMNGVSGRVGVAIQNKGVFGFVMGCMGDTVTIWI